MESEPAAIALEKRRALEKEMYARKTDFTDRGRANLLRQIVGGTLRFVPERRHWLMWRDGRWHVDEHETFARERALQVAFSYESCARVEKEKAAQARDSAQGKAHLKAAEEFTKESLRCRNRPTLDNMLHELAHSLGVPLKVTDLDRNPELLGAQNGTVNLRTGELLTEESAEEFITRRCTVDYVPSATAPRWEKFIEEITAEPAPGPVGSYAPRPDLARYLQKMLGYCLTGWTREHKVFIAVGDGSNGKSVVFEMVKYILGVYAVIFPSDALTATKNLGDSERPTSVAASLAGARYALASETREGQKLDVGLVKNHTGDAQMSARRLRENAVTFNITHKLVLFTNIAPTIDHMDAATRGRLHMIPFARKWNRPGEVTRDANLPDGDKELANDLRAESEGVLAWLVRGAVMYCSEGLEPPEAVRSLTTGYVLKQDPLGRWISEECVPCNVKEGELAKDLFDAFGDWCVREDELLSCINPKAFGAALDRKQVPGERTKYGARRGLRRKTDEFEDLAA